MYKNKVIHEIVPNDKEYAQCKPIYKTFKGWSEDITHTTKYNKLPINAQKYVSFVAESLGIPITYISVGNDRVRTIKN
jgi:adenylosuccinate synthase